MREYALIFFLIWYNMVMSESVIETIRGKSKDIIGDNNFLFVAFENRLIVRLLHIFEKYKIQMNKNVLKRNIDENLINSLMDINREILGKYVKLISNYENIIMGYVNNKTKTEVIKKSTMEFINRFKEKNDSYVQVSVANNFIEYINSIIYVYDSNELNSEIISRIKMDVSEVINEFNRNNYNFFIESINDVIKNIIKNM